MASRLAKKNRARQYPLFNSALFVFEKTTAGSSFFVAGPSVGAPMAVLTLEKLIALGARYIIVYGWCGSLQEFFRIGDVLLPTETFSEEGTSAHYPMDADKKESSWLREYVDNALQLRNIQTVAGPVWTTDAPYRETKEKLSRYRQKGILGVDMEYSALRRVASFRGADIAAVFLASDELWRQPWQPGFTKKNFAEKSEVILQHLFEICGFFEPRDCRTNT
jgi:uridine phosphorylase